MTALVMRDGKLLTVDGKLTTCVSACCDPCLALCGGVPSICGMQVDSLAATTLDTWAPGTEITWHNVGGTLPTEMASHPYAGNPDWQLCYCASIPLMPDQLSTLVTFDTNTTATLGSDTLRITANETWRYRNINSQNCVLAIHYNATTNTFTQSIKPSFTLQFPRSLVSSQYRINTTTVAAGFDVRLTPSGFVSQATYTAWTLRTIATCEDIFDPFSISAVSPGLVEIPDTTPLAMSPYTTAPSVLTGPDFIYRVAPAYTVTARRNRVNGAAPAITITLTPCG